MQTRAIDVCQTNLRHGEKLKSSGGLRSPARARSGVCFRMLFCCILTKRGDLGEEVSIMKAHLAKRGAIVLAILVFALVVGAAAGFSDPCNPCYRYVWPTSSCCWAKTYVSQPSSCCCGTCYPSCYYYSCSPYRSCCSSYWPCGRVSCYYRTSCYPSTCCYARYPCCP